MMLSSDLSDRTLPYRGLTGEQVKLNRQQYGINVLTPPQRVSWWNLYLEKFADPVIRILTIAATIAIAVGWVEGDYIEGVGILVAILLATTLAFANEYRASREFELLDRVYDRVPVKVIRDGDFTTIFRQDVVVGDIVYVEQGEEIPADGEILEEVCLYSDRAKITGESEPIKHWTRSAAIDLEVEESTYPVFNLYRGTLVAQGRGVLQVSAVGDRTEIGQLARAVATVETDGTTPLSIQLEKLSHSISIVGFSVSILTFLGLLIRGFLTEELILNREQEYILIILLLGVIVVLIPIWIPIFYKGLKLIDRTIQAPNFIKTNKLKLWLISITTGIFLLVIGIVLGDADGLISLEDPDWLPAEALETLLGYFMIAVTIIVVAVPEGLAMSVTLALAYSMRKMAASNNLVRRMHACETIGAATVICSDKTGTLTQNKMEVREVNFPSWQENERQYKSLIAEAIAVNSTANLEKKPQQEPRPIGNVTEGALLLWLDRQKIDYLTYRYRFDFISQLTFCAKKKYMATLGISPVLGEKVIYFKGAPEVILDRCSEILTERGAMPLTNQESLLATIQDCQSQGMRALGFGYYRVPETVTQIDLEKVDSHLIWLGFATIADPLRPEALEAIQSCLQAGIEVKIVTGDSPQTAEEIARAVGLLSDEKVSRDPAVHLTGKQFNRLSEEEALNAVKSLKILSRAAPLDKLKLVQLLQKNGEVVAVTGDGTNDAAALKQAQVGLAMGSGTAIAKEASDTILLDDSFKSIVNGVLWGRSLYENIQRFILFQLTINLVALGMALLGPFMGVALPLTVTQMLWVNLIMDTFAALALATEPPHWTVMQRRPRQPDEFIVSALMAKQIAIAGLGFLGFLLSFLGYLNRDGEVTQRELSIFFAVFVLLQFWNLFNARCLGSSQSAWTGLSDNQAFIAIAAIVFIGQILIVQFGGEVFRTVPLSLTDWLWIVIGTSSVLWAGELCRAIARLNLS